MINFFKDYFNFNSQQRNGVIVLFAIIVLLISAIKISPYLIHQPELEIVSINGNAPAENNFTKQEAVLDEEVKTAALFELNETTLHEEKSALSKFNPNTVTESELIKLGFSKKLMQTLVNFRNKGGHFYKREDLRKIYGIKESQYLSLEPYIDISVPSNNISDAPEKNLISKKLLELNASDSLNLIQLKGIGPAFAHRIITYRAALGGYTSLEQLKEVYGLDSNLYALVEKQLELDNNPIRKININKADFNLLRKHPYINNQIAKLIVNYRDQHGSYKSVNELTRIDLISDKFLLKLAPYLSVE